MRVGLVGTGYWAHEAHAKGVHLTDDAELVAVWGRHAERTAATAQAVGARAHTDFDAFLADVDLVTFSVPPHVQASLAIQAAGAGKHMLLEKPVALDVTQAHALEAAVKRAGVATAVFFTGSFTSERQAWLADLRSGGYAEGGWAVCLASAFASGSPFDTPWRREKGGLWDVGPHILAALTEALGPIDRVLAAATGAADLSHLTLCHHSGATSTVTTTLSASPAAATAELAVWGSRGVQKMPRSTAPVEQIFSVALTELMQSAKTGSPHRLDVTFGARIVEVIAQAEQLM